MPVKAGDVSQVPRVFPAEADVSQYLTMSRFLIPYREELKYDSKHPKIRVLNLVNIVKLINLELCGV